MLNCNSLDRKVNYKINSDFVADCPSLAEKPGDMASAGKQFLIRHTNELASTDNEIHILKTNQTPEFILNQEGIIKIQGRGLYSDKPESADQISVWIEAYLTNPANITYVTIAFEFLNSLSTSLMVSLLKKLSRISLLSKKLVIRWYYEGDDENILDRGKYISSYCNIPIEFILTNNISHL